MRPSVPFYIIAFIATFLVRNHPFFWDTIQLASKHAHFFYETDFQSIILPETIDSGHPPVFGMYLAAAWKLFGKTLPVSHFAMLPFLWGIVFFLYKTGEKLAGKENAFWLLLLCFADPVLASQGILVSPDVALVCFFLMGLWAVWEKKAGWLTLAVMGLGLVSMRGMMIGAGLYFFSLFIENKITVKSAFLNLLPFVPGGLAAAGFLFYHWQQTGWIGYHENSTWAPSFARVNLYQFIKNVAVLIWRMLDFGRVFLWIALAAVMAVLLKKQGWNSFRFHRKKTSWQLAGLLMIIALATIPTQLFYKGLLAHRYLLPVFLSLHLLFFYLLFKNLPSGRTAYNFRMATLIFVIVGLLGGNCWVYPKKVSQGWDSTLAHLPWYSLQKDAASFLQESGIDYRQAGTAFPNIGPRQMIEMNGAGEGFVEKNLAENCYILYSNIMNDFTDAEIDTLETQWLTVYKKEKGGICVVLYQNPNKEKCAN